MFPIKEKLLTPNRWSRPGTKLTKVEGIVIHWTANENRGADALANIAFFENRKYGKTGFGSAHYFVDSKSIWRCLPEDELAYHVGATSYKTSRFGSYPNKTTLGIEMCVNADGDFKTVYQQTVELAAMLLKKYNLNPDLDLVRHYDVTGKNCPAMFTSMHWGKVNHSYAVKYGVGSNADRAWENFKDDVKAEINPKSKPAPISSNPVLKQGATGEAVRRLQSRLNALGFNAGIADGQFGPGTHSAVVKFQSARKLTADGIVGPATWAELEKPNPKPVEPAPSVWYRVRKSWADAGSQVGAFRDIDGAKEVADKHPGYSVYNESGKALYTSAPPKPNYELPSGIIKRGDRGTNVKLLQVALNTAKFNCGTPDGIFGPGTEDALKRFQSVYANPADGIYGSATRAALDRVIN